jgi:hypothetical protein
MYRDVLNLLSAIFKHSCFPAFLSGHLVWRVALAAAMGMMAADRAAANVTSKAVTETAEYVIKKFSREVGTEGVEKLAARIEKLAVRHGDEALEAVRKVGPKAIKLADDAGEQGAAAVRVLARYGDEGAQFVVARPQAMKLVAQYGDDAAEALVKHKEIAEPVIEKFGASAVRALKNVDPQNGRRIATMMVDGELAKIGRTSELLDVVGKYGNKGMDFVWKNKAPLAVTAGLAAFLADPGPFIDGTRDLAQVVAENTVGALAQAPAELAKEAAKTTNWTLVTIVGIGAIVVLSSLRAWFRHRAALRKLAS